MILYIIDDHYQMQILGLTDVVAGLISHDMDLGLVVCFFSLNVGCCCFSFVSCDCLK